MYRKQLYCHPLLFDLPLFQYNGGLLGMNLYTLLSLESIPVYGNTVDLGQKCINKLHKTIDALKTAR